MVLLLDVERVPINVWDNPKDRDVAHRKINLNQTFKQISAVHRVEAEWIRQRFARAQRKIEWIIRTGKIDPVPFVHPALIEMHLLFRTRSYEFWDATKERLFTPQEEAKLLRDLCHKVGISFKQWRYMTGIMYAAGYAVARQKDEQVVRTQPLAVWDRFTAMQQEWTPEAQYREFYEMTGEIE